MNQEWRRLKAHVTETPLLDTLASTETWELEVIKQADDEQLQAFAVNKTTIGDINDMYYAKRKLEEFIRSLDTNNPIFTLK